MNPLKGGSLGGRMLQKLKEELVIKTSELNLLKNKKKELELDIFNKEKR